MNYQISMLFLGSVEGFFERSKTVVAAIAIAFLPLHRALYYYVDNLVINDFLKYDFYINDANPNFISYI